MKQLLSLCLLLATAGAAIGQQAQPWLINRRSTATNYTATATDWYIAATATLTNTLPTVASVRNGQAYIIKDTGGNVVTIRPTGGNTIDGTAGDLILTNRQEVTLVGNGSTNWEKVMSFGESFPQLWNEIAGSKAELTNRMEAMEFGHNVANGDDPTIYATFYATVTAAYEDYASVFLPVSTTSAAVNLSTTVANVEKSSIILFTDDSSASIRLEIDGALTDGFHVETPSGYTGTGTLFLSDDGTYKTAGGGATINPTDGYLAYRSNATTFADSPWYRISTNAVGFTLTNYFISTAGLDSLFIGQDAGPQDQIGLDFSVAIGPFALSSIPSSTGAGTNDSFTVIGSYALQNLIDGNHNTFMGQEAGSSGVSVSGSTAMGSGAGGNWTNIQGSTFVGFRAGASTVGPGSITNAINIGFLVQATNNNEIVIGNTNNTAAIFPITSYTGAGTLFLSDDGTYKAAGGSGSSPFTNIAGIVQFTPGQAVTNELRVVSGSADAATNVAFRVDTASPWSAGGSLIAAQTAGSTRFRIDGNSGYLGTGTKVLWDDGFFRESSTNATITYTNVFNYNGRVNYNADVYVTNATIYINNVDVRTVSYGGAASDQTTALTTGTNKLVFRLPTGMTLTAVRANLLTAQASGSTFTVDINENNTSVLSTKLTIDNTETTSTTAATPAVISDSALADDSEIEIDIDQVGDGTAVGLKVWLIGTRLP